MKISHEFQMFCILVTVVERVRGENFPRAAHHVNRNDGNGESVNERARAEI